MGISRRGFFKIAGATAAGGLVGDRLLQFGPAAVYAQPLKIQYAKESTTICPYCAVGCGAIVSASNGKVINIEGDPDHPINQGSLCPKGASLFQLANNEQRITHVMYRAPYSDTWEQKPWDWALDQIARRIKKSRDESFTATNAKGQVVNRCEGMASVGSAAMDNEECWLYQKLMRSLGLVYIEHQARI